MINYNIEKTKITPWLKLIIGEEFSIIGDSRPEDVSEFYNPIIEWFSELNNTCIETNESKEFSIVFFMEYLNSSSVIFLSKVLKKITEISELDNVLFKVEWKHLEYDEDMKELGKEFNTIYSNLKINIVSV
jgi:hypothetical protein